MTNPPDSSAADTQQEGPHRRESTLLLRPLPGTALVKTIAVLLVLGFVAGMAYGITLVFGWDFKFPMFDAKGNPTTEFYATLAVIGALLVLVIGHHLWLKTLPGRSLGVAVDETHDPR